MTSIRKLVLEKAITKSLDLVREAISLAEELRVKPSEAIYALMPAPET